MVPMRSKILHRRAKRLGWLAKEQSSFITELLLYTKVAIVFSGGNSLSYRCMPLLSLVAWFERHNFNLNLSAPLYLWTAPNAKSQLIGKYSVAGKD